MENKAKTTQAHEKANIYKNLCIFAPDAMTYAKDTKIFGKWLKKESFHDTKTNFKGILYSDGNEYVICYLGTDSKSVKDHLENLIIGILGKNMQMRIADYFYKKCKEKYGFYNDTLTLTGHSEGGTEATYTGIKNKIKTITFNPFGISRKLLVEDMNYDDIITNYRDEADLVSKLKENTGKTYIVPSIINQCKIKQFFGSLKSHKISNFGDCEKAVPLEDYKKSHPLFISSYKLLSKL